MDSIRACLQAHPEGLSEYEMIRLLRGEGFFEGESSSPTDAHTLFRTHFLLFHALYRLRDALWAIRQGHLEITPLKIRLLSYQAGEAALAFPDPLREYYLDFARLESTTAEDVSDLLVGFWTRMQRQDQRAEALAKLGLVDPVDDQTIKHAYRRLAMIHHPDRGGDKARLQAINAAADILLK